MFTPDLLWTIAGILLTLMIFSYIAGDNALFRFAAYLFVGVSAGYVFLTLLLDVLVPRLILPLLTGSALERVLGIVPLVLSILLLARLFPRIAVAGNVPMAFLVGAGAAIAVGGALLGTLFPQVLGTINLFDLRNSDGPGLQLIDGLFILVGAASTLLYFYFGARQQPNQPAQRNPVIERFAEVGKVFIGITLGALFAGVYSAALAALIERVSSITNFIRMFTG
jgi:hypothetical protein